LNICKKCNTQTKPNANFCSNCGNKLSGICKYCWIKKQQYNCGLQSCPAYKLYAIELERTE